MRLTNAKKALFVLAYIADEVDDWIDLISLPMSVYFGADSSSRRYKFRRVANELVKIGEIEKKIIDGKILYRLSSKGLDRLVFDFPIFRFSRRKWDGYWTFVTYDIAESNRGARDKLRRKLYELTFGAYQKSVWITPHPVVEEVSSYIEGERLSDFVHIFRTKQITGDPKKLAWKVFKLEALEKRYSDFIRKWDKNLQAGVFKRKKELFKVFASEYYTILSSDPGLPIDLLPDKWEGERGKKLFNYILRKYK
jgi:phenylacetic acid degradation operon negative regulatory protein